MPPTMSRYAARAVLTLALAALLVALSAVPVGAAAPTITSFSDSPTDDVVADCGGYQIREVSTFSATAISYSDGTTRVHASIDGWLYRTDNPDTVIGREHARTVRLIDGSVAQVTGNRWHIVIFGSGVTVHDVGRLDFNFETGEVLAESGNHPVSNGEFDFATLCDL